MGTSYLRRLEVTLIRVREDTTQTEFGLGGFLLSNGNGQLVITLYISNHGHHWDKLTRSTLFSPPRVGRNWWLSKLHIAKKLNYVYVHDRVAPMKLGARQTPSFVRILCTLFDTGLTQAASRVSRVVKPGCIVSNIFFLGFNCDSGSDSARLRA